MEYTKQPIAFMKQLERLKERGLIVTVASNHQNEDNLRYHPI
jgi:hypothetical protein